MIVFVPDFSKQYSPILSTTLRRRIKFYISFCVLSYLCIIFSSFTYFSSNIVWTFEIHRLFWNLYRYQLSNNSLPPDPLSYPGSWAVQGPGLACGSQHQAGHDVSSLLAVMHQYSIQVGCLSGIGTILFCYSLLKIIIINLGSSLELLDTQTPNPRNFDWNTLDPPKYHHIDCNPISHFTHY